MDLHFNLPINLKIIKSKMEPYRTLIFQDFLSNGIIFLILRYLKNTFTIDALISVKKKCQPPTS